MTSIEAAVQRYVSGIHAYHAHPEVAALSAARRG